MSFFTDNIILSVENSKEPTKKLLKVKFCKFAECKVSIVTVNFKGQLDRVKGRQDSW